MKKIFIHNLDDASIKDWEDYFDELFIDRNKKLEPRFMWLKVIEHSTRIAEGIRKRRFFEAISSVSRVFCWICTFIRANKELFEMNEGIILSLEDIFWNKYPRCCSYCAPPLNEEIMNEINKYGGRRCSCRSDIEDISHKRVTLDHLKDYREKLPRPKSLKEWGKMIDAIFSEKHNLMSIDSICFHFLEEVGEVLTALRSNTDFIYNIPKKDYTIDKAKKLFILDPNFKEIFKDENAKYEDFIEETLKAIREEVADVISWLFALTSKLLTLRTSFSNYEIKASKLLEEIKEVGAFNTLLGYNILHHTPKEKILNLSSILYIWYGNGCTKCNNYKKDINSKCRCDIDISRLFITIEKELEERQNNP